MGPGSLFHQQRRRHRRSGTRKAAAQVVSTYFSLGPFVSFYPCRGSPGKLLTRHFSYYFLNTGRTSDGKLQKIEAFPKGFQMIVGDNRSRNSTVPDPDPNPLGPWPDESQEVRAQRALGFNCLNYARGSDEPSLARHFLPDKAYLDKNCADGIRLELMFPSCWNGELDGGKDHKSHVAFPDGVMVGDCPEGYDRRLVSLFYETIVATDLFKDKNGKFVFSNGDPTGECCPDFLDDFCILEVSSQGWLVELIFYFIGFGYHGDFIEAWAPGVLQDAVDQCTNPSGNMEDCPVFTYNSEPGSCGLENALPAEIASDNVKGPMKGLPNQVQVQTGPEPANKPSQPDKEAEPVESPKQSLKVTPTAIAKIPTVPVSDSPKPSSSRQAAKDDETENLIAQQQPSEVYPSASTKSSAEAPPSLPPSPSTTTSAPALAPPPAPTSTPDDPAVLSQAGRAISTTYWTEGRQAHKLIVILEEVTVTADGPTVTQTAEAGPEPHYKRGHDHRKYHAARRGIGGRKLR